MHTQTTAGPSTERILAFLGLSWQPPSRAFLDELVWSYVRHVPWETAFRIAKRAAAPTVEECPRWPDEFWRDALERGGGGTCYESNYAFFALLRDLGFEGYLTINDMGDLRGCHAAIVAEVDEGCWLVDVGYPLYLPVPLARNQVTCRRTPFHTYTLTPKDGDRYEVSRDRHPQPYIFTLNGWPVPDEAYRAITARDYGPEGQFLDELIIHKVIGDRIWRFNGRAEPPVLESFPAQPGQTKTSTVLDRDRARELAIRFQMDQVVLAQALAALQNP